MVLYAGPNEQSMIVKTCICFKLVFLSNSCSINKRSNDPYHQSWVVMGSNMQHCVTCLLLKKNKNLFAKKTKGQMFRLIKNINKCS